MPTSTDPRDILRHVQRVRRDDILRPAGERLLEAYGAANSLRRHDAQMVKGRIVFAFVAGVVLGLIVALVLGDTPARAAATVLQAQEAAKW